MADRSLAPAPGRTWLPALAIVSAIGLCYGPFLGRGFTSEDFLLVRFLREHPPWQGFWSGLGEPWLGISGIRFMRPVSTLIYGLETAAFGATAPAYNLVHALLHAGNALLLCAVGRALGLRAAAAAGAGILFALYPLHPNAVLFSASFATLIGAAFMLGSFWLYVRFRATGRQGLWVAAAASFVLALGSYETAIVLPAWVVAYEVLIARRDRGWRASFLAGLPFAVLAALYLGARYRVLGAALGGYPDLGRQLLGLDWLGWVGDLGRSLVRLHWPVYERPLSNAALAGGLLALVAAPLGWLCARARRVGRNESGLALWILGALVVVSSLAPFAFRPAVPGNGRYWYLAAAGASLCWATIAQGAVAAIGRSAVSWLPRVAFGLVVIASAWLLVGYLRTYRAAASTAAELQGQMIVEPWCATGEPVFLAGSPQFLLASGTPVAPVFHYGLWDSVHPPFVAGQCAVFPLPPLAESELDVLAGRPVLIWDEESNRLRRVLDIPPAGAALADLPVRPPTQLLLDPEQPQSLGYRFAPAAPATAYRLLVVARGNPTVVAVASPAGAAEIEAFLPSDFLFTMRRLYGGEVFWWLEGRDAAGVLVARSALQAARLSADPMAARSR